MKFGTYKKCAISLIYWLKIQNLFLNTLIVNKICIRSVNFLELALISTSNEQTKTNEMEFSISLMFVHTHRQQRTILM